MLPCPDIFAASDKLLLHIRATLRRRGMTVPRNSLTRYTARHLRIRHLVQFICVGPVSNNALKNCAALSCRACVELPTCVAERYPTLRIRGYMSARSASLRKKNSSAVPLLRSGHMSAICARLGSKGKVGVQRGRETVGVPSFLPPRRAPHVPALRRAQIPLNRRRKPRFNIDFTQKNTLYLNLTNSRFCILQNFRKIIL